jgi:hypothetical protein
MFMVGVFSFGEKISHADGATIDGLADQSESTVADNISIGLF